jgi:two-component system OmpR family response regulator
MSYGRAKKIFLVDDDEMLSSALQDFLTRKVAHHIRVFNTGEEALKHMSENPDVVILDYYLNTVAKDAMNGMEILQNIKKYSPKTSVIMLSSQERYGIAMQTLQKGAEQYVIKDENSFEKIAEMVEEIE